MSTHVFTARDEYGRHCRIQVRREESTDKARAGKDGALPQLRYVMEDGSDVRRIDNDTFQVIATGAYVTRVDA
ncbi:hypothetical protein OVA13_11080 [Pseudoxanthomonas sp. SL93]|uniref:hypothetical protein n=1 Tax=Pseudoxanthomonas sp. SL93 TaxID=2995142 RepID=UPI00226FEF15|nr:hypothetical protein [Pseudoxanthomonas sp. SL93]WAC61947.1 hypothetical protein OVA13_11080 [Pseudoxanthomonas sp. SL93]